jgi:hypothetical protein
MTIFRCFSIVVVIGLLPAQHLSCCLHSPTSLNPEQFTSTPISILHHTYYCLQQKWFECRVITKSTLLEVLNVSSQVSDTISKWQNILLFAFRLPHVALEGNILFTEFQYCKQVTTTPGINCRASVLWEASNWLQYKEYYTSQPSMDHRTWKSPRHNLNFLQGHVSMLQLGNLQTKNFADIHCEFMRS